MSRRPRGRILIVEPDANGHRFHYVNHLACAAIKGGHEVTLLTLPAAEPRVEDLLSDSIRAGMQVHVAQTLSGGAVKLCAEIANDRRAETIVIPDGDRWLWPLYRHRRKFGDLAWRLLLMRPLSPKSRSPRIRTALRDGFRWVLALRLARLRQVEIYALRPSFSQESLSPWLQGGITDLEEYAQCRHSKASRSQLRTRLDIPMEGCVVGVIGAVSPRKNPVLVAQAVAHRNAEGKPTYLCLAGPQSAHVAEDLSALARDLGAKALVRNSQLTDEEVDAYIAAVDAVAVLHSEDVPSNVLAKAAVAGVPVIVPPAGLISRIAEAAALGVAVANLTPEAVAEAVDRLPVVEPRNGQSDVLFATQLLGLS